MKSAGKARNNGLYRHIRTSKEIIRNLLNDLTKYYSLFCNHTFDLSDVSGAEYHDFCDLLSDSQCETARILQRDERNRSLRIGNKQCADFIFSFLIWSSKLDFTVGNIIVTSINT